MSQLRVTLDRSTIGYPKDQKMTARNIGLRRLHQSVIVPDNPAMRGMIRKISHLVTVEPVETGELAS